MLLKEDIHTLESVAPAIGVVTSRFNTEEDLNQKKEYP
jgi:hypothetical protein